MAWRRHRAATLLPRRCGRAAERAIATIEMAILTPVMLLLVTVSCQAALWQEADHVALAAAESGVAAGAEVGGSPDGAKGEALSAASQMGSGVLTSPGASVRESGGLVTVTVTGQSEQLVPGIPVSVERVGIGPPRGTPRVIRTRASRSGRRRQGGVATLEMSLLMLPVLLLAELGVAGGRYAQAQAYATAAAYSAARAASLAASPQQAQSAAQSAAQASVQGAGAACGGMTASTNVSDFTPGGNVTVTVTCQVSYSDLLVLPLPGSVTVTGTAVSPVDLFRVT